MKFYIAVGAVVALLIVAVWSVFYLTYDMTSAERCLKYGKCALLPSR